MIVGAPFLARSLRDKWVFLRHAKKNPTSPKTGEKWGTQLANPQSSNYKIAHLPNYPIYSAFHPFTSTLGLAAPNSLAR
jgi:hypothetical protein